jgi:nucleotide-binding universal stress UspA family protein
MKADPDVRRIDVGIDGSRGATAALSTAARLARSLDARLRLVAVAELHLGLADDVSHSDPAELERLERHLSRAAASLGDIAVETELREGPADQVIQGLARESDLLVLGSRAAYGDAGRTSLGSIAARIMVGSPIPTLIVPAP